MSTMLIYTKDDKKALILNQKALMACFFQDRSVRRRYRYNVLEKNYFQVLIMQWRLRKDWLEKNWKMTYLEVHGR